MNEQCTITFEQNAVIHGVCDPSQYEHPYEGNGGYDPNWISCFYPDQYYEKHGNQIYCFTPNQGHGNNADPCGKAGCETVATTPALPTELPKSGQGFGDSLLLCLGFALMLVAAYAIYENWGKK